jgi:ketosteroid isomerase-like protein
MSRDKLEIAKRALDAYNGLYSATMPENASVDVEPLFAEFATPDFEWRGFAASYEGGSYQGREGVERAVAETRATWEEIRALPEEFRDLGDRVLVLGRVQARGTNSGAQVDAPLASVLDFRGDRICRIRSYLDHAEGIRAAGLSA